MRTLALLLLSGICAAAAAAPGEIDSLIRSARTLPPEFAADSLVRIAGIGQVDRTRKIELIEEAFRQAAKAEMPLKRRPALTSMPGPVSFLSKVYQQDLDALDLEVRAANAMLAVDPARARKLFQAIPPLKVPRTTCSDYMVYDVDEFYDAAAAMARSFSEKEVRAGAPFRFLQPYAAGVTSPVQVAPMAKAIAGAQLTDADFKGLVGAFAGALGKISADDRSFTFSAPAATQIEALTRECQRRNVSPLPLLEAYRLYLVVNLSDQRCVDDELMQGGTMAAYGTASDKVVPDVVLFFNSRLRLDPLQAIREEEATPKRLEGSASGPKGCTDEQCKAIVEHYDRLILAENGAPLSASQRATPEWNARLRKVLDELVAWNPGKDTTPAEQFRDKASIFNQLLNLAPAGEGRNAVLKAELAYIVDGRKKAANRVEWFLPFNALMARTTLDPAGFGAFGTELQKSADPVVALYARLEAVAPRPADRLILLL